MGHAEATVTIERPVEAVFDFLADGTTNARWRSGIIEIRKQSGDGLGAVYGQKLRGPGGRPIDGDYRVTSFERPSLLGFEVIAGPARPKGIYKLTPNGPGSTSLTFALDLQARGFMKLMAPAINRQLQREVGAVQELKRVLEAQR